MRPKLRSFIPRSNRSHNTHDKPKPATDHRMQHRPRRSEPCRNISPHNPIHRSQRQRPICRRLSWRRKHPNRMQRQIRHQSQNQCHHNSGNHRTKTSTKRPHTHLRQKISIPVHPACHNFWCCINRHPERTFVGICQTQSTRHPTTLAAILDKRAKSASRVIGP